MSVFKHTSAGIVSWLLRVALLALFIGFSYALISVERDRVITNISQDLRKEAAAKVRTLREQIEQVQRDVLFLATVPPIQGIMRASENGGHDPVENSSFVQWQQRLTTIFSAYLAANPGTLQVRYIAADQQGQELVRVDADATGHPIPITGDALQQKGHRDYVQHTLAQQPGMFYVSDITLNRERNEIEVPYKPVIRIGMPVFAERGDTNAPFGLIIINLDARRVFDLFKEGQKADLQLYVTNSAGDYLVHPDPDRTFGFDLGKRYRWLADFQPERTESTSDQVKWYKHDEESVLTVSGQIPLETTTQQRFLTLRLAMPYPVIQRHYIKDGLWGLILSLTGSSLILMLGYLLWSGNRQRLHLREEQARSTAILESSLDAVISEAPNGHVIDWNPSATRIFGHPRSEAIGKPIADLLIPATQRKLDDSQLEKVKQGIATSHFNSRYRTQSGKHLDVSVSMSAIKDDKGNLIGIARTIRDISEQVAIERKILRLNTSLEQQVSDRTREIRRYHAFQDAILNHAGHAIVATDPTGVISLFNPAAERLLGYRASEMIGKQTPAAFHLPSEVVARAEALSAELGEFIEPGFDVFVVKSRLGLPNTNEWTYLRKGGSHVPVQLTVTALRNDTDGITGYLGMATDISEQVATRRDLVAAKEQADRANRAKSEFLANMSHEIRTPMNGVLGVTELLQKTQLDARQREYLGLITNSAYALLNILNDILDLSKIEAGKIELENVPFSLEARVGSVMKSFAPTAHEKGLELNYYIAPYVPPCVAGDPLRLSQIIFNLVGNAIKFTAAGEVCVSIDVADQFQGNLDALQPGDRIPLRIQIRDTGIGISEDKLASIFDAFSQADNSTTRKFGGTGLGLSIVSQLVQLMEGKITVASTPDRGSRFTVEIALQIAAAGAIEEQHEMPWLADSAAVEGIRCLAVDDNATNRLWLKDMLESWGCIVDVAVSVDEALQKLKQLHTEDGRVDVLLLDKNMPEQDGFALIEALPEHQLPRPGVILMLSSSDGENDMTKCRELGIQQYLVKPVQQSEIYNTLLTTLGLTTLNPASLQAHSLPEKIAPLNLLIAEDNPVNQRLVNDILEDRGHRITMVDNGQKALDLATSATWDAVLMDVQMPIMDGLEATRRIRSAETDHHLRIIGLTAHALKGDREMCLAAGMDEYLTKPIDPNKLIMMLENHPDDTRSTPTAATTGDDAANATVFDLDQGLRVTRGNRELLTKMAHLTIKLLEDTIPEIEKHCQAADWQAAGADIHKLKGAAGNMASAAFTKALQVLERIGADGNGSDFAENWPPVKALLHQLLAELTAFTQQDG